MFCNISCVLKRQTVSNRRSHGNFILKSIDTATSHYLLMELSLSSNMSRDIVERGTNSIGYEIDEIKILRPWSEIPFVLVGFILSWKFPQGCVIGENIVAICESKSKQSYPLKNRKILLSQQSLSVISNWSFCTAVNYWLCNLFFHFTN